MFEPPSTFLPELHAAAQDLGFSAILEAPRISNTLEIDLLFPSASSWSVVFIDDDGRRVNLDLVHTVGSPPRSVPGVPAMGLAELADPLRLTYLILKRLRKREQGKETWEALAAQAAAMGPPLRPYLGERSAAHIFAALASGHAPDAGAMRRAHWSMRRRRLLSSRLPSLVARTLVMAFRRSFRPAGTFISFGGVDGSGKSAVTDAVVSWSPFRRVRRLHSRPGFLKPPGWFLGRQPSDGADPHGAHPWGLAVSRLRLLYYWFDFTLGYWVRIWPVRVRGGLVVSERWWWDMYTDPRRHRLTPMPNTALRLGRLVPRPDVFFLLDAPSESILKRKRELDGPEIERQRSAWQRAKPKIANLRTIDATAPLSDVSRAVLDAVAEAQRANIVRSRRRWRRWIG